MRWYRHILRLFILLSLGITASYYLHGHTDVANKLMPAPSTSLGTNIYAHANKEMFAPATRSALLRVYVPNSQEKTVSIIDPKTYKVVDTFVAGKNPQHVVPTYDLKTLWVLNDKGNSVIPIDPDTAKPGEQIKVEDPYNLYFTPDGQFAIVVAEEKKRLDLRDPHTMALIESIPINCRGVNHLDFTADGHYAIATCEFSGQLLKLDLLTHKVVGYLDLGKGAMPQDVRASPNGQIFYVADMMRDGIFMVDPVTFKEIGFIATGIGTHSIYPSRNGDLFYVANRGCHSVTRCRRQGPGSVAVLDPQTNKIVSIWPLVGGGSPDMGNVSADGKELWLSGRYDAEVYVFDTATGQLTHRIPVGRGPHGLTFWPQPGRYSLGHTGNMR